MKKDNILSLVLVCFMPLAQSCNVVEGIFKAGMWWAFFLVALVVFGLFLLFRKR